MEPETCEALPAGVGVVDFMAPGSQELMDANIEGLPTHTIVVWRKHGVMARSDDSATRAVDRVDCAETAGRYEYMTSWLADVPRD